ncbi:tetratricopeptide repeat protein [Desulfovibrio sp. Huiquan2017]|uniref:tetratricopeptide repeat protein n=1 Tax=Desulfovibrio sp. Huiquan2017 TaxID=2816861 RepID=UPI001A91ECA7|nr:tetratricopeptide repeat protein [Desulfovibrio sp. Huiquan2017]
MKLIHTLLAITIIILAASTAFASPYEKALQLNQDGNYEAAFQIYLQEAQKGDARAQAKVGLFYSAGIGVMRDDIKAQRWLHKSADQGSADAMSYLGSLYESPSSPLHSYDLARKWYMEAAQKGNSNAMTSLGYMYLEEKGVKRDCQKAEGWFQKVAALGYDVNFSMEQLTKICGTKSGSYEDGKIAYKVKNYARAREIFLNLSKKNDVRAIYMIGYMDMYGEGSLQNEINGIKGYRKAAEMGYAEAQHSLGFSYRLGNGVPQDYKKAVYWYQKAADQNLCSAQNSLGYMYEQGKGVIKDYVLAHKWYNLSSVNCKGSVRDRDNLEKQMTPSQIAEAQKLAREWKPNQ